MKAENFWQLMGLTALVGMISLLILVIVTNPKESPAYCSKCEHIYFDNDAHCGVCGTEYIKNKPEVTEKWES